MGLMAVPGFPVGPVVIPLLEGAVGPHLVLLQVRKDGVNFPCKSIVSQLQGCRACIGKAFPDDGQIGRGAVERTPGIAGRGDVDIFRRGGGRSDPFPILLHQRAQAEAGRTLENRVVALQIGPVPRKEPMLPDMGGKPGAAHVPIGPGGVSHPQAHRAGHGPDIAVVGLAPGILNTIEVPCGLASVDGQPLQEAQQHLMHLRKGGRLRRPVIFFQVDVGGVIAAPRRVHALVPEALQIGGDARGTGAGDEEVSAILEIKGFQLRIGLPGGIAPELLVRRQGLHLGSRLPKVQGHAAKEFPIIGPVALPEAHPILPAGL